MELHIESTVSIIDDDFEISWDKDSRLSYYRPYKNGRFGEYRLMGYFRCLREAIDVFEEVFRPEEEKDAS